MSKSTTYQSDIFDDGTYESYPNEKNWWDESELHKVLAARKLGVIVRYDEADCKAIYDFYTDIYEQDVSFICENKKTKSYQHFNVQ